MAESVVQIVWICAGFSLMVLSCGERRVLNLPYGRAEPDIVHAGSHWESEHVHSRSSLWDSPLTLQSLDTHFPHSLWPEIQDVLLGVFSHLLYCCSCSTLRPRRGQSHKKKRDRNETVRVLPLCSHFSRFWLLSTIRLLLSTFQSSSCVVFCPEFSVSERNGVYVDGTFVSCQ